MSEKRIVIWGQLFERFHKLLNYWNLFKFEQPKFRAPGKYTFYRFYEIWILIFIDLFIDQFGKSRNQNDEVETQFGTNKTEFDKISNQFGNIRTYFAFWYDYFRMIMMDYWLLFLICKIIIILFYEYDYFILWVWLFWYDYRWLFSTNFIPFSAFPTECNRSSSLKRYFVFSL